MKDMISRHIKEEKSILLLEKRLVIVPPLWIGYWWQCWWVSPRNVRRVICFLDCYLSYWSCISLVFCFSDETLHLYIMSSPGHLRHLLADHCLASPQRTNRGWQLHTSGEAKRTRFAGRLHENEKESGTECLLQERLQRTTHSGAPHIHWQSRLRVCNISSIPV